MVFSRVGVVLVAALAAPAPAAPAMMAHASPAQPTPERAPEPGQPAIETIPLRSAGDDTTLTLEELRGTIVALHFLGSGDHGGHVEFLREFQTKAHRAAGLRHLYILPGTLEDAQSLLQHAAAEGLEPAVWHDEGGALATALSIQGDGERLDPATLPPVTVVLEVDGTELFRTQGRQAHDHPTFDDFAASLREATATRAIAQYNLPRRSRLAVEGYDVVAYFTQRRAVRGVERFTSEYRSVEYRFSSEAHRDLFAADPEAYMPTYGGWCASAMGDGGRKVEISPTNFKIQDGRLHLFYKDIISNALTDWNRHPEWEAQADNHWRRLADEEPRLPE